MADSEGRLLGLAGDGGQSVFELLQRNQVLLAKSLELQFLDLTNFPHASKHFPLVAHSARTIHRDTVALFQRFSVTAKYIVNTLMPMLLDGIELAEPSLVAGAFELVLSSVQDMRSGDSTIQSSYEELVSKIQNANAEIQKAEEKRREEIQKQVENIVNAEKDLNNKIQALRSELTILQGKATDTSKEITHNESKESHLCDEIEKRKTEATQQFQSQTQGELSMEHRNQVFIGLTLLYALTIKQNEIEQVRRQISSKKGNLDELNKHIQKKNGAKDELVERLQIYAEEKAGKIAEKPINPEGGGIAWYVLQNLMPELHKICEFWNTMVQNVRPLATEQEAARVYQNTTSNERVRQFFMEKMSLSQKGWQRFDNLCSIFVVHFRQDPKERLETLFAFLSAPIGQSQDAIDARAAVLRKAMCGIQL